MTSGQAHGPEPQAPHPPSPHVHQEGRVSNVHQPQPPQPRCLLARGSGAGNPQEYKLLVRPGLASSRKPAGPAVRAAGVERERLGEPASRNPGPAPRPREGHGASLSASPHLRRLLADRGGPFRPGCGCLTRVDSLRLPRPRDRPQPAEPGPEHGGAGGAALPQGCGQLGAQG